MIRMSELLSVEAEFIDTVRLSSPKGCVTVHMKDGRSIVIWCKTEPEAINTRNRIIQEVRLKIGEANNGDL